MWACGITMYEILTGKHPYEYEKKEWNNDKFIEWLAKVRKFKYPKKMSEHAKNLISRLCSHK
jgi:serine/threonine protein kinase